MAQDLEPSSRIAITIIDKVEEGDVEETKADEEEIRTDPSTATPMAHTCTMPHKIAPTKDPHMKTEQPGSIRWAVAKFVVSGTGLQATDMMWQDVI